MNTDKIKALPIESSLQLRLCELMEQFESYRIYNDVDIIVKEKKSEKEEVKEESSSKPKKKRKISFLEKLFLTEYDDE